MITLFIILLLSYLLGSISCAFLAGRIIKKIDLRLHGSGNLGATNVFRVLGKKAGLCVLLLDILKGTLAVTLCHIIYGKGIIHISENLFLCLGAIAVVAGHNWTIFLRFKGGKGIATSLGALIAFALIIDNFAWVVLIAIIAWVVIFLSTGFVSLASIMASVLLPIFAIFLHLSLEIILFLSGLSLLSLIRHKSNISRLLRKKENRFNTQKILQKLRLRKRFP